MRRNASFWRNVAIIGVVHVIVISAVVRWGGMAGKPPPAAILWMDGGAGIAPAAFAPMDDTAPPNSSDMPPPVGREEPELPNESADTALTSGMQSDIALATPTPTATQSPIPTAASTVAPKRSPKPTPTATVKPKQKKTLLAKASATASRPKPSATPAAKENPKDETSEPSLSPPVSTDVPSAIAAAASTGTAATVGLSAVGTGGSGGSGVGSGGASQFGWYAHMLHDRFFSQWDQPTSVVRSGARMSTLVKLRIEKDGRVSRFTILKPSGNVVVDESVATVGKRVKQVDPLPGGFGDSYDVNINFELNSD
ncbi:MAG: TonB family protein [Chthoniobacterales bacterium]|nr:TonB family protein [Chthoniobacterales bacterium]